MDEVERWAKGFRARMDAIDIRTKQRKFVVDASWFVGGTFSFFLWFYAKEKMLIVVEPDLLSVIVGVLLITIFAYFFQVVAAFIWAHLRKN